MDWMYSLRTRLIALYTLLIVFGIGGLAIWVGQQIETAAEEDFAIRAESEVSLVALALHEPVEDYLERANGNASASQLLDTYVEGTQNQLNLIDNRGEIWASSGTLDPTIDYFALPEIISARQGAVTHDIRRDERDDDDLAIFTAAPVIEDGQIVSIVQLVFSLDDVDSTVQARWYSLGGGATVLGIVVMMASIFISATVTRPLSTLREAAEQIAEGDFSVHVPETNRDELGQVAKTFNDMVQRVESMIEEQRAFASNVSHELKTPLTTMQLRIEALQNGALDDEKRTRYITEIESELDRMNHLVEDLILLSRIDAGSMEIGRDHVDLSRFARQLIREMESRNEQITINLAADENLPSVSANLTHLRVVFRNILDNAIKYMGAENGVINWEITRQGNMIQNIITDTGRGIAPDELESVIKRFYRADKARSRSIQGSGLGLSLVQSIIETYGGTFKINSEGLGKGTAVTITWQATDNDY